MRGVVLGNDEEVGKGSEEMDEIQTFDDCDLPSSMLEVILNSLRDFLQRNSIDYC